MQEKHSMPKGMPPKSMRSFVSEKIRKLKGEGKGQDQAVAIALSMARKKKK